MILSTAAIIVSKHQQDLNSRSTSGINETLTKYTRQQEANNNQIRQKLESLGVILNDSFDLGKLENRVDFLTQKLESEFGDLVKVNATSSTNSPKNTTTTTITTSKTTNISSTATLGGKEDASG